VVHAIANVGSALVEEETLFLLVSRVGRLLDELSAIRSNLIGICGSVQISFGW
jgi:hypothetical protein